MPSVSSEIIAEITAHMGKFGGDFSAWRAGTARDWHSAVLEAHQREEQDDDLICRQASTPASARSVRLHFVNDCASAQGSGDGVAPTGTCPDEIGRSACAHFTS